MSRVHTSRFVVEFGDCDPAQIVFYPNYLRWMDAASLHFFRAAGVPPWRELEAQTGIIGTPHGRRRGQVPASGHPTAMRSRSTPRLTEWRGKSFVLAHRIRRGDDVLVEGREVRDLRTATSGPTRRASRRCRRPTTFARAVRMKEDLTTWTARRYRQYGGALRTRRSAGCSRHRSIWPSAAGWCSWHWSSCRSSRSPDASSSPRRCPAMSKFCRCAPRSRRRRSSRTAT